jgi:GntR family transcriptional regulator
MSSRLSELCHTNHLTDTSYPYQLYFCHLNEEDLVAGAKYKQIADDLRQQITSGTLAPGGQLPTEPQLAAAHAASRSTVRLAIGLLIQQGLVETRQGMGTYVTEPATPITVLLSREEDWRIDEPADAALPPAGERASRQTAGRFQAETTSANAEVAVALDVAEGAPIVLRRTHRYLGKDPWSLVVSYYPMDIVKGTALEQAGPLSKSASLVLAEHGHEPVGYRDDIYARMPDAIETAFFQLSSVVPVTIVSRTAYDASRPVQLTRYVYRADRLRLRHEMGSIPLT